MKTLLDLYNAATGYNVIYEALESGYLITIKKRGKETERFADSDFHRLIDTVFAHYQFPEPKEDQDS